MSIFIVYIGIDVRYKPGSLRNLLKIFCKDDLNFKKLNKLERQTFFPTAYIRIILK